MDSEKAFSDLMELFHDLGYYICGNLCKHMPEGFSWHLNDYDDLIAEEMYINHCKNCPVFKYFIDR